MHTVKELNSSSSGIFENLRSGFVHLAAALGLEEEEEEEAPAADVRYYLLRMASEMVL